MSAVEQSKDSVITKMIVTILIGVIVWVAKDLYTRVLDKISDNSDKITDVRIIVESLKQ